MLLADVDIESYPLRRPEGRGDHAASARVLPFRSIPPLACETSLAGPLAPCAATLARVTHDRQAKDRYPAAIWTELLARAQASSKEDSSTLSLVRSVGEGDVAANFDPMACRDMEVRQVECLAPQRLSSEAVPLGLYRRDPRQSGWAAGAAPAVRLAVESYLTCPLCWFMGSRVRFRGLDAGFLTWRRATLCMTCCSACTRSLWRTARVA